MAEPEPPDYASEFLHNELVPVLLQAGIFLFFLAQAALYAYAVYVVLQIIGDTLHLL